MFSCTHCERQLADQESFDQHRCAVHQLYYKCGLCAEEFHLLTSFMVHGKNAHAGQSQAQFQNPRQQNDRVKCHECGEHFASKPEMFTHKARVHKLKHSNCKICHLNLDSEMLLLEHTKAKHPGVELPTLIRSISVAGVPGVPGVVGVANRQFRCVCGMEFRSESARQEHARAKGHSQEPESLPAWQASTNSSQVSVTQQIPVPSPIPPTPQIQQIPNRCHECQAVFDTVLAFNNHNKAVHYFQCNKCEAHFKNALFMHEHQRKAHSFPCKCGQLYPDALALARHQHEEHCLQCPKCDSKFEAFAHFLQHMEERHEFRCSKCLAVLGTPDSLSMHYQEFHSLVCAICQMGFDNTPSFLRHQAQSHRFRCMRCPAVFEEARGLALHYHAGVVIKCSRCEDEFIDGLLFAKHMETNHSFKCAKCESGHFQSSSALEQHEMVEHRISCPNCERAFEDSASFLEHKRVEHPRLMVEKEQRRISPSSTDYNLVSFLN